MRRVVPSQIREFIQAVFGNEIDPAWNLPKEHSAKLAALLMICEGLPDELLTLTGPDYAKYVAALGTIQHQLTAWNYKADPPTLPHVFGKNPLAVIYNLLEQCADEFPSPSTSALAFVADLELRDSIRLDISAANRDLASHEYKGATVLAGSATEALLLWAINELETQQNGAIEAGVRKAVAANDLPKRPASELEKWSLSELIEVALHLNRIKNDTAKQARLGKDFRNLIHPGRAARLQKKCDRGSAFAALATVELVVRDLTP